MASAIIVAAIPFPDAYAYDTSASVPAYEEVSGSNTNFNDSRHSYSSDHDFSTTNSAYNVMQTTAGTWLLDKQFDYSMTPNGGYITQYNDLYPTDNISLSNEVYYDYAYLTQADVEKFYNTSDQRYIDIDLHYGNSSSEPKTVESLRYNYVLDGEYQDSNEIHLWLNRFFPTDVQNYRDAYAEYIAYQGTEEELNHPKPDSIIKTNADVYATDDERIIFLCRNVFGDGTPAVSLVSAVNQELQRAGSDGKVFLPNVGSAYGSHSTTIDGHTYWVDDDGFLCESQDQVIGIAKEAFKGVKNVNTLNMAPEITYIGDSAFEDSFITAVTLPNGALVGNKAFKNCTKLLSADISGVSKIFDETFRGSALTEVTIPEACSEVGHGAFANCENLATVNFDPAGAVGQTSKTIDDYAFYNNTSLNAVNFNNAKVTGIGKAAFAMPEGSNSNSLSSFVFPSTIGTTGTTENIGEYCLAGRDNLKNVTFSNGINDKIVDNVFHNCKGLECVTFEDNCINASYDSSDGDKNSMFYTVTNPNFYVRGPKLKSALEAADPRRSTWKARFDIDSNGGEGKPVPYVYTENGEDFYEVSNGEYLLVIDKETGELISCKFAEEKKDIEKFTIPAVVGDTVVTGIKEGCFEGEAGVLDSIINLVIEDGSNITSLDDNTFAGADKLETADLGDSVTSIGNGAFENCPRLSEVTFSPNITSIGENAFQNCPKLENITFESPADLSVFPDGNIGTNAFNTGANKLTLHGEIGNGYAPFEWATNPENYANKSQSIRTLYKTPAPSSLSVILDNQNNLATLVDYPHYEDLDKVVYDDSLGKLVEYDTATSGSIMEKINNGVTLNNLEETMVQNCSNLVIPEGVESIDTLGFFNDSSDNPNNISPKYSNKASVSAYFSNSHPYDSYSKYGLFNGYNGDEIGTDGQMREYESDNSLEEVAKGNDRLTSIMMYDVVYLPDKAFESCENLVTAYLGDDIRDAGIRPFAGCKNTTSVAFGNDAYTCENGIIYKNNSDGSKSVVEGLESIGTNSGPGYKNLDVSNYPSLADVSSIDENAFEDCLGIKNVDLTGINQLKKIPAECFKGCEQMKYIEFPSNIEEIGARAFMHTADGLTVVDKGLETYLDADTNGPVGDKVKDSTYMAYENNTIARKLADKQEYDVMPLDNIWTVKYYVDREMVDREYVEDGERAKGPENDPVKEGYTFVTWVKEGSDGSETIKNTRITDNVLFFASFEANSTTTPGSTPGTTPGNSSGTTPASGTTPGSNASATSNPKTSPTVSATPSSAKKYKLQVVYGSGSGDYAADTTVIIEAIDAPAGKEFDKWVVSGNSNPTIYSTTSKATTLKMPAGDCVVTATYKDSTNSSRTSTSVSTRNGSTGAGTGTSTVPNRNTGTVVNITRPGISNVDKAYASVSGSTDNFIVKITESSDAANQVATALSQKYGDMSPIKYFAMDISLYDATGTTKISDVNGLSVNITMPIPDALTQYAGNNRVGAVNGLTLEELPCKFVTVSGVPCVSFTATHFSPYTIYVDTSNLTYGTIDSTPKTGDGIHPKWFVSIALFSVSIILFLKKDKVKKAPKVA